MSGPAPFKLPCGCMCWYLWARGAQFHACPEHKDDFGGYAAKKDKKP